MNPIRKYTTTVLYYLKHVPILSVSVILVTLTFLLFFCSTKTKSTILRNNNQHSLQECNCNTIMNYPKKPNNNCIIQ